MYELVILEDELTHIELLEEKLACYKRREMFQLRAFREVGELERYLATGVNVDIIIVDIEFDACDVNGIDVVAKHFPSGSGTQVIYVTGHIEYCTQVYRTQHQYFIVKPVKQDEFDDALDKALNALTHLANNPLILKVSGKQVMVLPRRIIYIESSLRKLRIHTMTGTLETYGSLAAIKKMLPLCFMQCHKSFLVNMDYIMELKNNCIKLCSEEILPVSQSQSKQVRETLMGHLGRTL